jgi:small subunit ribosomal protein S17e
MFGGKYLGNVRTDQIKRTGNELMKRFHSKFTTDFEANKKLVALLAEGTTVKVRNQIAGYITRSIAFEQTPQTDEEEAPEETDEES